MASTTDKRKESLEVDDKFNNSHFVNSDKIEQEISNITSFHYYLLLSKFSLRKCDSQ